MSQLVRKALAIYDELRGSGMGGCSAIIYNDCLKCKSEEITNTTLRVKVEMYKDIEGAIRLEHTFKAGKGSMYESKEIKTRTDIITSGVLNFIVDFERELIV